MKMALRLIGSIGLFIGLLVGFALAVGKPERIPIHSMKAELTKPQAAAHLGM